MHPMRLRVVILAAIALSAGAAFMSASAPAQTTSSTNPVAYSIELQADIDPATEKWMSSALDDAADQNAALVIIRLDTPGGLDDSLRTIVKDIVSGADAGGRLRLAQRRSRRVRGRVHHPGGRRRRDGAGDEHRLGHADLQLDGADIGGTTRPRRSTTTPRRSCAPSPTSHGRNADLAEQMVSDATNFTAQEALRSGLDRHDRARARTTLLQQLNGFQIKGPKAQTLDTTGLQIDDRDMPFQLRGAEILVNPNVGYLLLHPRVRRDRRRVLQPGPDPSRSVRRDRSRPRLLRERPAPGQRGGRDPARPRLRPDHRRGAPADARASGGGGAWRCLAVGGLLLYNTSNSAFELAPVVVVAVAAVLGGGLLFVVRRVIAARQLPKKDGWEELVGSVAVVRQPLDPNGQVYVHGALWRAAAKDDGPAGRPIIPGIESGWNQ